MSYFWDAILEVLFRSREQYAVPVLDGNFVPNNALESLRQIGNAVNQADDIVDGSDGCLYVSSEKRVLRCSGHDFEKREDFREFEANTGGLAFHPDGRLLVCVSGQGLAAIDSTTRRQHWLKEVDGIPLKCLTAVATAPDGTVYLTDGSTKNQPEKWCWDLLEQNAFGRLVKVEPDLGKAVTLCSGLKYPHGVTLSHDGKDLLFTESWGHTISRYGLYDSNAGMRKLINRNLPGYPARITQASAGSYWLSFFAMRTLLVEFVLREKEYKREMMRTIDPAYWIAPALSSTGSYLEPLQGGGIKKLGIRKPWSPPRSYGLVARINEQGDAIESFHSRVGGHCHGITSAREVKGRLIVVSKGHSRLLIMDSREIVS